MSKTNHGAKYLGTPANGYPSISGIPARDLSSDEVARFGEKALEETGLYRILRPRNDKEKSNGR